MFIKKKRVNKNDYFQLQKIYISKAQLKKNGKKNVLNLCV